ncbi:MAG: flagellar hook-length control protein FliK [Terriglobia bacterium]
MNTSALQLAAAPGDPASPSQFGPLHGNSPFQKQLDQAVQQSDPQPDAKGSTMPTSPRHFAPWTQPGAANAHSPATASGASGQAVPTAAPNPAAPVPSNSQGVGSADTQGTTTNSTTNAPASASGQSPSSPVGGQFAWLAAMLPIAGIIEKLAGHGSAAAADPKSSRTAQIEPFSGKPSATPNNGDVPADGSAVATAATISAASSVGSMIADAETGAPSTLDATGAAKAMEPQQQEAASAPESPVASAALAPSFERIGVSLLSISAATSGSSVPPVQANVSHTAQQPTSHASSTASSAAVRPATAPADASAQSAARDASLANATPAQASSSHTALPDSAKTQDAASGNNAKNGSSQDAGGKFQGSAQGGNPAASTAAAGAIASTAVQAASSGFASALNQTAQAASGTGHAGAATQSGGSQPTTGSKIAAAMDASANLPNGVVNAASMIQTQGKAEMRVALQTESMGTLQLHAVLDNGKLGASIAVVSHEAHTLLTSELPALQQVLTDQNLRLDRLTVINSPMMTGGGAGNGAGSHAGDSEQAGNLAPRWFSGGSAPSFTGGGKEAPVHEEVRRRLSVRA